MRYSITIQRSVQRTYAAGWCLFRVSAKDRSQRTGRFGDRADKLASRGLQDAQQLRADDGQRRQFSQRFDLSGVQHLPRHETALDFDEFHTFRRV